MNGGANRNKDGLTVNSTKMKVNAMKCPGTIFNYSNGGDKIHMKREHPGHLPRQNPLRLHKNIHKRGGSGSGPNGGVRLNPHNSKNFKQKILRH